MRLFQLLSFVVAATSSSVIRFDTDFGRREFEIHCSDQVTCATDVAVWCRQNPDLDEQGCNEVLLNGVLARTAPDRDVRYRDKYKADVLSRYESMRTAEVTTSPKGSRPLAPADDASEASDFYSSSNSLHHDSPSCNLLGSLPIFSSRLSRPAYLDGLLSPSFSSPVGPPLPPYVIMLRVHIRASLLSEKTMEVTSTREPALACLQGLQDALRSLPAVVASKTSVHVFLNGFDSEERLLDFKTFVERFLEPAANADGCGEGDTSLNGECETSYSLFVHVDVPRGNALSFRHVLSTLRGLDLPSSSIVFLVEDDTFLLPSSLAEMYDVFESHDPCFVTPIDHPDYYYLASASQRDVLSSPSMILAGSSRHWRTVPTLAVTYAARLSTLDYFAALMPIPTDDFFRSVRLTRDHGASIVSPLPTLAAICEQLSVFGEETWSLYLKHEWARELYKRGEMALCNFWGFEGDCIERAKQKRTGFTS